MGGKEKDGSDPITEIFSELPECLIRACCNLHGDVENSIQFTPPRILELPALKEWST